VVLSLATDKAVWEAVLANEKIQEFRHTFVNVEGILSISLHASEHVMIDIWLLKSSVSSFTNYDVSDASWTIMTLLCAS
jgi:hypothetical protein